jgi:hypothetical protein
VSTPRWMFWARKSMRFRVTTTPFGKTSTIRLTEDHPPMRQPGR